MKILILGSKGQLAKEFKRVCKNKKNFFFLNLTKKITKENYKKFEYLVLKKKPKIIINCLAYTNVNKTKRNISEANYINNFFLDDLSLTCKKNLILLIHFSTDYVYGNKNKKLHIKEHFTSNPVNIYGKTKLAGENQIKKNKPNFIIFRIQWLYGDKENNFFYKIIKFYKKNNKLFIDPSEYGTPTSTNFVVKNILLVIRKINTKKINKKYLGIFNLSPNKNANRYFVARYFFKLLKKYNLYTIENTKIKKMKLEKEVNRQINSKLSKLKFKKVFGTKLNSWEEDMNFFVKNIKKKKYKFFLKIL